MVAQHTPIEPNAACRLLTSGHLWILTCGRVLIPVAFFPRTGIDAYAPLATVTIGGLTIGTVLALYVVPVLHTYTDDLARLVRAAARGLRARREERGA